MWVWVQQMIHDAKMGLWDGIKEKTKCAATAVSQLPRFYPSSTFALSLSLVEERIPFRCCRIDQTIWSQADVNDPRQIGQVCCNNLFHSEGCCSALVNNMQD